MTSFAKGIRFYVNPKAKYLSNAVENILYNIGKSDRSFLAWQTCRTNLRSLNNRRISAQRDTVPLTRRVSSIWKVPGWKRDEVDIAERRKNIFYQMLKASQDIGDDNEMRSMLRPNSIERQNGGAHNMEVKDDRIFNEIYDKLKGYLNKPTNVAKNPFLLLNSSSIYKEPIAKDQKDTVFRPYPGMPVYKVHHKKKVTTKSTPQGSRKVKKSSVALSKKSKNRKSLKFRGTVQFGKTVKSRRPHSGSKSESIAGSQQSRPSISRVVEPTVLLPKLDNNLNVSALRIDPKANKISSTTLASAVNERLASDDTVYSIPIPRKMEESVDVSKLNILKSPRASSESELSRGSQGSHIPSGYPVRTLGSRSRPPKRQISKQKQTLEQRINSLLLPLSQKYMSSKENAATSGHKSQASHMQKFNQNKNTKSIKNRSLASTKQGRKLIKKSELSRISAPVTLRTSTRQKSKRIKRIELFQMKRKIFSLLPNDIFVNEKRRQILEQIQLDEANRNAQKPYEQRFSKLQHLYDGHSGFDDADDLTLDGIHVDELLLYPYQLQETFISKHSHANSHSNSQAFHKATKLPVARPLKSKKAVKEKSSKLLKNKPPTTCLSGCCICKQIHRNSYEKDAPFIAQMKRESKRLELKAYIAQRQINVEKRRLQDIRDDQIIRQTVTVCQGVPHCIRVTHMPKEKPILIEA